MKVLAILQARFNSTRLAGKVLKPILDKPMLAHQIARVQQCRNIDRLLVATSIESSDSAIVELCHDLGVKVYRGSLDDVLDRFYQAAKEYSSEHVVRLTGDCPLADSGVIDAVIAQHMQDNNDYTSNVTPPTFPDGLDVEMMRFSVLEQMWKVAKKTSEREHVTAYVHNHKEHYRMGNYSAKEDLSAWRWTVDEPEDFAFVTAVYECLYPDNPHFTMEDVVGLIRQHPELLEINQNFDTPK
jgi:spore coat polysaccharide biosynthesis protein SpsF